MLFPKNMAMDGSRKGVSSGTTRSSISSTCFEKDGSTFEDTLLSDNFNRRECARHTKLCVEASLASPALPSHLEHIPHICCCHLANCCALVCELGINSITVIDCCSPLRHTSFELPELHCESCVLQVAHAHSRGEVHEFVMRR